MLRFPGDAEVDTSPSGMACVQEKIKGQNVVSLFRDKKCGALFLFQAGKALPCLAPLGSSGTFYKAQPKTIPPALTKAGEVQRHASKHFPQETADGDF